MDELPERRRQRWWLLERDQVLWSLERWPLIRHLLVEPRFRWAWFAVIGLTLLLFVAVPKIWITSPPDSGTTVRVSLIDLLESRILRDVALRAEAEGRPAEAFVLWRSALHNNPADENIIRGSISNTFLLPVRNARHFATAIGNTLWLLQLRRTNRADLDFAIRVYERFGVDDLLLETLRHVSPLDAWELAAGCRALIRTGQGQSYPDLRAQLPVGGEDDPLALHDAAHAAGWSADPAARRDGEAVLRRVAEGNGERALTALRLVLLVHAIHTNALDFGATLGRLRDLHADDPVQHAVHWRLLDLAGQRGEAVRRAREFSEPPVTSQEVLRVAEAFILLGMIDDAVKYLEQFAPEVGVTGDVWLALSDLLIREKRWPDLRRVAAGIRLNERARGMLGGYAYYLEGLAMREEGGAKEASESFELVPSGNFLDSELALDTARRLTEYGSPAPAYKLLEQLYSAQKRNPPYWTARVRAAHAMRDADRLMESASEGYLATPADSTMVNNLVAALIVTRSDPDRLINLATYLYGLHPDSLAVKVNYSFALAYAGRGREALEVLDGLPATTPGASEAGMIAFARAESYAQIGDHAQAYRESLAVDVTSLLPGQVERLTMIRTESSARSGNAPAGSE